MADGAVNIFFYINLDPFQFWNFKPNFFIFFFQTLTPHCVYRIHGGFAQCSKRPWVNSYYSAGEGPEPLYHQEFPPGSFSFFFIRCFYWLSYLSFEILTTLKLPFLLLLMLTSLYWGQLRLSTCLRLQDRFELFAVGV